MTLWLLARASGFVVLAAATLAVVLGTWASTPGASDRRVVSALVHRTSGLTMIALLPLHIIAMVLDSFVDISWTGALVPFTSQWKPLAVGLGTLAFWGFLVVIASGLLRGRLTRWTSAVRLWRIIHLAAWVILALGLAHSVLAGTDTTAPLALATYGLCVLALVTALVARLVLKPGRVGRPVRSGGLFEQVKPR